MRTYMMFIEYIPTLAFSRANFLIFAGRISAKLECKSENDHLMNTNKQRCFLWSHHLLPEYLSHLKINKYQAQNSVKSFLLRLMSYGLNLKLKTEMKKEPFLMRNFWTRKRSANY